MRINRRSFLNLLWFVPFYPLYLYLKTDNGVTKKSVAVPLENIAVNSIYLIKDLQLGIVNKEGIIAVISIACTHLGCTLNISGDILICPCHGSRFSFDGDVLEGPAVRPLKKVDFVIKDGKAVIFYA